MPHRFGPYQLLRVLGEGGMAQVWSAWRKGPAGTLPCAVKVLRPEHAVHSERRARFEGEARRSRSLGSHPHVVTVFDAGEHQGQPYLAMDRVEGLTVAELAQRIAMPWPVVHATYVVASVLRALVHVHTGGTNGRGLVHCDVSPHNVMVGPRGEVKLIDFGIAQVVGAPPISGEALGKLRYVPREQVDGDPDERSDLYAVGALLFELLDGRRFRWHCADDDALLQELHRDRVPTLRRDDVPPQVTALLDALLQPQRERRVASAAQALQVLEAWPGFRWVPQELAELLEALVGRGGVATKVYEAATVDQVRARERARSSSATRASASAPEPEAPCVLQALVEQDTDRSEQADAPEPAAGAEPDGRTAVYEVASAPSPRQAARTESAPASQSPARATTGDAPALVEEHASTRVLAQAEQLPALDALDRVVTRRHRSSPQPANVPQARSAAEIAVTRPTPSRRAPWASEADPLLRKRAHAESGAPEPRNEEAVESSVSARPRESASMHRAANGVRTPVRPGDLVRGEIAADDTVGGRVWSGPSRRAPSS